MYSAAQKRMLQLPPFQPGTQDLRAVPNPTFSVVCAYVGQHDDGVPAIGAIRDGWHLLADTSGGYYFLPRFAPGRTHTISNVSPDEDPRAAYLAGYWRGRGHSVSVMHAVRIDTPHILGRVDATANGELMKTSFGVFTLHADLYLLQSPVTRGLYWLMDEARLKREFIQLDAPDGSCVRKL